MAEPASFEALDQAIGAVLDAKTTNFFELAEMLGLDPKQDFAGADLAGVDLSRGDLSNANLTNANLTDANLTNANLTNANLTDANLTNANLTNANLDGATLDGATLDGATLHVKAVVANSNQVISETILNPATFQGREVALKSGDAPSHLPTDSPADNDQRPDPPRIPQR